MTSDEQSGVKINSDELPVLLHAIVEAKFSATPGDRAVISSPLLANIAKRVASAMLNGSGELATIQATAYKDWLNFQGHVDFWRVAVIYAKCEYKKRWETWDESQRLSNIDNLIAPFFLTHTGYGEFITEFLGED